MAGLKPLDLRTEVRRISLPNCADVTKAIQDECRALASMGYALKGTFCIEDDLILVFQNPACKLP
jgi:hypothetical protein